MKEATHFRKGSVIRNADTGVDEVFDSINLAKKASRKMQTSGSVMSVVSKFPAGSSATNK